MKSKEDKNANRSKAGKGNDAVEILDGQTARLLLLQAQNSHYAHQPKEIKGIAIGSCSRQELSFGLRYAPGHLIQLYEDLKRDLSDCLLDYFTDWVRGTDERRATNRFLRNNARLCRRTVKRLRHLEDSSAERDPRLWHLAITGPNSLIRNLILPTPRNAHGERCLIGSGVAPFEAPGCPRCLGHRLEEVCLADDSESDDEAAEGKNKTAKSGRQSST